MPRTLNNLLISIGKIIGQITILALVAGLFITPVTAMLMASFYIASVLAHGIGVFVGFVMFWVLIGFIAWYVTPHVQPQISNAITAQGTAQTTKASRQLPPTRTSTSPVNATGRISPTSSPLV